MTLYGLSKVDVPNIIYDKIIIPEQSDETYVKTLSSS